MKKALFVLIAAVLMVGNLSFSTRVTPAAAKDEPTILEFGSMVGVPKPYTGNTNPIRGIGGGGLPWVVGSANGELSGSGKVEVKVRGLVLDPNDPDVIARGLAGNNPINTFKVIVSCQSVDAGGNATIVNLSTRTFPATTGLAANGGGNAKIEDRVSLPHPCIAPIIFVTNAAGAWFAATGN
jgi:hypothetical protein